MPERKKGKLRIGAALFNGDHGRLAEEVQKLTDAGVDFIHLDVYDGYFVSDLGFPPRTIESLRPLTTLPFEVHLGAIDPFRFIPVLVEAGAERIISHIESMPMVYEAVYKMRRSNIQVGLALTLGTPVSRIEPVISMLDAVLLLSRVTGEDTVGAQFNPLVVDRVVSVNELKNRRGAKIEIQVAGSVGRENVPGLVRAGVNSIVFGGAIYKSDDMAAEVKSIRESMG